MHVSKPSASSKHYYYLPAATSDPLRDSLLQFYADLFHLVQDHCSLLTKTRIEEIPFTFVETMYDVLRTVRLLSSS